MDQLDIFMMTDPEIVQFPVYLYRTSGAGVRFEVPGHRKEFELLGEDRCLDFIPSRDQVQLIYDWFEDIVKRTIARDLKWKKRQVKPFCDGLVAQFETWKEDTVVDLNKFLEMLITDSTTRSGKKWSMDFQFNGVSESVSMTTAQLDGPTYLERSFREKGLILSLGKDDWGAVLSMFTRTSRYVEPDLTLDPLTIIVEDILNVMRDSLVSKDDWTGGRTAFYYEGDLYFHNKLINTIAQGRISGSDGEQWCKLRDALTPYRSTEITDDGKEVVKAPRTLRFGNSRQRFWRFSPDKCGVPVQDTLDTLDTSQ